jgi:hypothetical protein
MICGPEVSDLIAEIYPDIGGDRDWADEFFLESAILCPRNSEVDEINAKLLSSFPGGAEFSIPQWKYCRRRH